MVKRGAVRISGGYSFVNGWINAFFPWATDRVNPFCKPFDRNDPVVYQSDFVEFVGGYSERRFPGQVKPGLNIEKLPSGMSKVDVQWVYMGEMVELFFHVCCTMCL